MASKNPVISIDIKGLEEARKVVDPKRYDNAVRNTKGKIRQTVYDIMGKWTPVLTGTLKASRYFTDTGAGWSAPYARRVNLTSKANAGYIDRAWKESADAAQDIVAEAVRSVR